jgi:hypothetical protein
MAVHLHHLQLQQQGRHLFRLLHSAMVKICIVSETRLQEDFSYLLKGQRKTQVSVECFDVYADPSLL